MISLCRTKILTLSMLTVAALLGLVVCGVCDSTRRAAMLPGLAHGEIGASRATLQKTFFFFLAVF